MAPTLNGPTARRATRSTGSAFSGAGPPSPGRRATRSRTGSASNRRTCELESGRRGRVEPLHVVDRNQQWLGLCERAQAGQNRDANRPRIRRPPPGLGKQERNLERAPPWRRHRRQHLVEHALEQVAETGMSEAALGHRRPRRQHPQ